MNVLSENKRKANKEHTCDWCSLKIKKGETYSIQNIESEGSLYSWKNHIHCGQVLDKIGACDLGDGIDGEDFKEYIKSEYQTVMSNNFNEEYESKDFKYPNFEGQLNKVLDFHNVSRNG